VTILFNEKKKFEIRQKALPLSHSHFISYPNNSGSVYHNTTEYSTALLFYNYAESTKHLNLQIYKNNLELLIKTL